MMRSLLLLASLLLALPTAADEAKIRQALEPKLGAKLDGVQATPLPGIFEIRFQGRDGLQIAYTDAQGAYLFMGSLFDMKAERNLTEERMQKLSAIDFKALPLDMAVKIQRGAGRRVLAMFTDPYCPYCRRFEQSLLQIDDITVYVFMYPVIRPDNADHSRAVWCSKDRAKAWLELAVGDTPKVPAGGANCPNPVDKVLELGRTLRVNSTPTLYFSNGEKVQGGMPLDALRARLDQLARPAAKK